MRARMIGRFLGTLGCLAVITGWSHVAHAGTLHVAANGTDSPACGTASAPCRSVNKAIDLGNPHDRIVVGPGRYGDLNGNGTLEPAAGEEAAANCSIAPTCLLNVTKPLTIESSAGSAVTVLDGGAANMIVVIQADDVVFGSGPTKGFTLTGEGYGGGLTVMDRAHVKVQGNQTTGQGTLGFWVHGREHTVADNVAVGHDYGFLIMSCSGCRISRNVASQSYYGFILSGRNTVLNGPNTDVLSNVAVGNNLYGFAIDPETGGACAGTSEITLRYNTATGNARAGIVVGSAPCTSAADLEIANNNIFGNGVAAMWAGGPVNCGLYNYSETKLTAGQNYWGAPTGPGADPADAVCESVPGTTDVARFATRPLAIVPPMRR
jgi:parallel beta-helix repeat protein